MTAIDPLLVFSTTGGSKVVWKDNCWLNATVSLIPRPLVGGWLAYTAQWEIFVWCKFFMFVSFVGILVNAKTKNVKISANELSNAKMTLLLFQDCTVFC